MHEGHIADIYETRDKRWIYKLARGAILMILQMTYFTDKYPEIRRSVFSLNLRVWFSSYLVGGFLCLEAA